MVKRTRSKRPTGQPKKENQALVPCPHCGQNIWKSASKCPHCDIPLTFLGRLERFSNATIFLATISTIVAAVVAVNSANVSVQQREVIEKIRADIEQTRSEANYTYVLGLHQKMENSAADWRRCKALQQPDCALLSLGFIAAASNAISAFQAERGKLREQELMSIQQLMCVGISIIHNDGKDRGLYDSVQDHRDAGIVDTIEDFLKMCPVYKLEQLPVHKLEK